MIPTKIKHVAFPKEFVKSSSLPKEIWKNRCEVNQPFYRQFVFSHQRKHSFIGIIKVFVLNIFEKTLFWKNFWKKSCFGRAFQQKFAKDFSNIFEVAVISAHAWTLILALKKTTLFFWTTSLLFRTLSRIYGRVSWENLFNKILNTPPTRRQIAVFLTTKVLGKLLLKNSTKIFFQNFSNIIKSNTFTIPVDRWHCWCQNWNKVSTFYKNIRYLKTELPRIYFFVFLQVVISSWQSLFEM